jgi:hypothetical protein
MPIGKQSKIRRRAQENQRIVMLEGLIGRLRGALASWRERCRTAEAGRDVLRKENKRLKAVVAKYEVTEELVNDEVAQAN